MGWLPSYKDIFILLSLDVRFLKGKPQGITFDCMFNKHNLQDSGRIHRAGVAGLARQRLSPTVAA
jgi:hypothetical protein